MAAFLFCLSRTAGADARCVRDIPAPAGYSRIAYPSDSFMAWLKNLPLKKDNRVISHNGAEVRGRSYNIFAVIDMPLLFKADLEQCADFCMRFWAEYHAAAKSLDRLYLFDYSGGKRYYGAENTSFVDFLRNSFAYSNSFSLLKGCVLVADGEARPGDMFVQNETGGVGHVSMIVDACENAAGDTLYLVGFSYMPAQEFHLEKAPDRYGKAGWFTFEGYRRFLADYYNYGPPCMRRF